MHELSITESSIDVALEKCSSKGFSCIGGIKALIGKASGVMPDVLFLKQNSLDEYS